MHLKGRYEDYSKMIGLALFCFCLTIGLSNQDATVTRLDVERFSYFSKEMKKIFNDKELEINILLNRTLGDLYNLDPKNVTKADLVPVFRRHDTTSALISDSLMNGIKRISPGVNLRSTRIFNRIKTFSMVHAETIMFAVHLGMDVLDIAGSIFMRKAINPSTVLQQEIHHLRTAKLEVDAEVVKVTTFLDTELNYLRKHLSAKDNAVGVPNKYTGSLTSAN